MRGLQRVLIAFAVAACLVPAASGLYRPRARGISALVPAYFYPGKTNLDAWEHMVSASRRIPLSVILNPASGPGEKADRNYLAILKKLRAADCKILGYVHTSYGARDFAAVRAEVEAYFRLYSVDGFFLDEMSTDPSTIGYYARIRNLIKGSDRSLEIVANPGTITTEAFVRRRLADVFVMFEGPAARFALYAAPDWVRRYPRERFASIVYETYDEEQMRRLVDLSVQNHFGGVFISDGSGPNPYDHLPPFWEDLLNAIGGALKPFPEEPEGLSSWSSR
jgi:hypothetical protein